MGDPYKEAGVDVAEGDARSAFAYKMAKTTWPKPNSGSPYRVYDFDFATGLNISPTYGDRMCVFSSDGVGTKSRFAARFNEYHGLGYDLVAANANDLLTCGAHPASLSNIISYSEMEDFAYKSVIKSIAAACREQGIIMTGGETAQLPEHTQYNGLFELAGTMMGIIGIDEAQIFNKKYRREDVITPDAVIIGLPSSGLHCNGFSLINQWFDQHINWTRAALEGLNEEAQDIIGNLVNWLLQPTENYAPWLRFLHCDDILAAAHITGGGVLNNIARVMPKTATAVLQRPHMLSVDPMWKSLIELLEISYEEAAKVFNMGIGYAIFVPKDEAESIINLWKANGLLGAKLIGIVRERKLEPVAQFIN